MKLEEWKLHEIKGGSAKGFAYFLALGIGGLLAIAAGILEGYSNPNKCRNTCVIKQICWQRYNSLNIVIF